MRPDCSCMGTKVEQMRTAQHLCTTSPMPHIPNTSSLQPTARTPPTLQHPFPPPTVTSPSPPPPQAKTAIPGLGAPITAIDVTYDGKWVLATTDHYLMLVKTTYTNDKGQPANAFESRMGGRGAVPRLLRLRPEDVAKVKGAKLSKGKFTFITEQGHSERWIVAGCGKFSLVWNFTRIRTGGTESIGYGGLPTSFDYFIRAKEEEVVDVAFVHQKYMRDEEQAALVVATPHSLFNLA